MEDKTTGTVAACGESAGDVTRKAGPEKTRASEDTFRDVAEKSVAGIYIVQDGTFKYVNPRFAEIHGYTVEELKCLSPGDVLFPEDLPVVEENLRKRISGETESIHYEFRIITKEGEIRHVEVYGSFTVYEGGPAIIGTLIDITERKKGDEALRQYREHLEDLVKERTAALEKEISGHKRTEAALRQSEEKYHTIFESAREGIFQSTPEGRLLNVNPAFAGIFGYDSPEEAVALVSDIATQIYANASDMESIKQQLAERGTVEGYEAEACRKDGKRIWISINAHAVRDESGEVRHYEGTNQDITERKGMERRLLESEERYRTAIELSNDGFALVAKGRYVYVNRKFLDIFGYHEPDEIVGKGLAVVIHPDDREMVSGYHYKRLRGEYVPSRYEFKGMKKDGTEVFIEVSAVVTSYHGEPVSLVYMRDTTERRQMEEKLRTMSIVDELTGLYNRRGFFALAARQVKLAERAGKGMELFFIDLDGMKRINDTLGHQAGDNALIDTAAILRQTFRESDIMGRMGGDEFAVLAIDAVDEDRDGLMKRLRDALGDHNRRETKEYDLSLSVGTALFDPKNPISLEDLITKADALMYEEKQGKQRCR